MNFFGKAVRRVIASVVAMSVTFGATAQTITYYHNDVSGTPIAATDAAGNLLWKESYRPYGEKLIRQATSSFNQIGFHGKPFDDNTGLSYMGARYYDPVLGRFLGTDSVGFDTSNIHSFNRYAYANNNPYKYVDPDGKMTMLAAGLLIVGVLFVAASIEARKQAPQPSTQTAASAFQQFKEGASNLASRAGQALGLKAEEAKADGGGEIVVADENKLPDDRLKAPPPKRGNAPIGDDGKPVELHHAGQEDDSEIVEKTSTDHRGKENNKKNHQNTGQDPSKIDRKKFDQMREKYWQKEWDKGRFDNLPKS